MQPIAAPKEKPKFINRTKGLVTQSVRANARACYELCNCLISFHSLPLWLGLTRFRAFYIKIGNKHRYFDISLFALAIRLD